MKMLRDKIKLKTKAFIGLFLLVVICFSINSWALTPPPLKWSQIQANGSRVTIIGSRDISFTILRKDKGPKRDIETHGYAYVLSRGIPLPKDWQTIVFEGTWWQEPARKKNYEEMTIFLFARYPALLHGKSLDGVRLKNFINISYDTWNKQLRFEDVGSMEGQKKTIRVNRNIPTKPRPFRLVVERNTESGLISWEFYEKEHGKWKLIYRCDHSNLFEEINSKKIYIKLGGWTTWEYPVSTRLRFNRLSYAIYNQPFLTEKESENEEISECLWEVPLPPGARKVKGTNISLKKTNGFMGEINGSVVLYSIGQPIERIIRFYKNISIKGWERALDLTAVENGGLMIWEKDDQSIQIVIGKGKSGETEIIIGCGEKLR